MTVGRRLDRGQYLFHEGSPVHGVYVVAAGAIKVHRVNPLGREQVIHVFRAFESFAEESLVAVGGHSVYACATEPSEVLLVRKAELIEVLATSRSWRWACSAPCIATRRSGPPAGRSDVEGREDPARDLAARTVSGPRQRAADPDPLAFDEAGAGGRAGHRQRDVVAHGRQTA